MYAIVWTNIVKYKAFTYRLNFSNNSFKHSFTDKIKYYEHDGLLVFKHIVNALSDYSSLLISFKTAYHCIVALILKLIADYTEVSVL